MQPETRKKIISLYYNWTPPRPDYGLPLCLADDLAHVRAIKQGDSLLTLEQLADASGYSLTYLEELSRALDEGVSEQEWEDFTQVRVARRKAPTET